MESSSAQEESANLKSANEELMRRNEALKEQMAMVKHNAELAQENARLVESNARLQNMASMASMMPPFPPPLWGDPYMEEAARMAAWGMPYMGMQSGSSSPGSNYSRGYGGFGQRRSEKGKGKERKRSNQMSNTSSMASSMGRTQTAGSRISKTRTDRSDMTIESIDESGDEGKAARIRLREKLVGKPEHRGPQTTAMMRNIPPEYTRAKLLDLVNSAGFKGAYDFVYLPIEFKRDVNLGYAFINFQSHEEAVRFRDHFQDFKGWDCESDKICEVSWSDVIQGFNDHVERYQNSPVMHETVPDEFKPAIFKNGERITFPAPTKKIRPPKQSKKDRDEKAKETQDGEDMDKASSLTKDADA